MVNLFTVIEKRQVSYCIFFPRSVNTSRNFCTMLFINSTSAALVGAPDLPPAN